MIIVINTSSVISKDEYSKLGVVSLKVNKSGIILNLENKKYINLDYLIKLFF